VTGVAALSIALALGSVTQREVFIVAPAIANQPGALAQYAQNSV
jgi:hypothetical protein